MANDAPKIARSMDGLREMLFDELDMLRAGTIETTRAKTTAALAMTLIRTVEVQIDFEAKRLDSKVPGALPAMPLLPKIKPSGA